MPGAQLLDEQPRQVEQCAGHLIGSRFDLDLDEKPAAGQVLGFYIDDRGLRGRGLFWVERVEQLQVRDLSVASPVQQGVQQFCQQRFVALAAEDVLEHEIVGKSENAWR